MKNRKWHGNAFWIDNNRKDAVRAILSFEDDSERFVKQEMTVHKFKKGTEEENPDFLEVMKVIGEEKIDANTDARIKRNQERRKREEEVKKAEKQRALLAKLFEEKIDVLEIDEIKNSKNRELKSKIRRAKSSIELQMYAIMLMMEETKENEENA